MGRGSDDSTHEPDTVRMWKMLQLMKQVFLLSLVTTSSYTPRSQRILCCLLSWKRSENSELMSQRNLENAFRERPRVPHLRAAMSLSSLRLEWTATTCALCKRFSTALWREHSVRHPIAAFQSCAICVLFQM